MIEAVVRDEKRVLPCSVYLDGEYAVKEAFCGVPVVLGRSGVERIVSFPMDEEEASLFSQAVSSA
jgi:malate dehydrogenase